jgi:glycine/D-amino acid oxidase-like deaminating enzyme
MERADVVVVGCGILGASVAYHLAKRQAGLRILVLEKEKAPCTGSTPLSAGGIRAQFTSEVNIRLSNHAIEFYEGMSDALECHFDFEQHGYLLVTAEEDTAARFRVNMELQRSLGVPVEELSPAQIQERWPFLETSDLVLGTFSGRDGYADPYEATMGFYQATRRMPNSGVEFRFATPVKGIEHEDGQITGVSTERGKIATKWVIDCAGPWLREVGELGGLDLQAEPVRRCLWNTEPFDQIKDKIPLTIDIDTGFYTRSESGGLMLGLANTKEPPGFNPILDDDWLEVVIERALARIPCLEHAEVNRGWAGHYSITPDHLPILGEIPWLKGFVSCGGFSGHGFMHAPPAGVLMAEIVCDGAPSSIDISSLSIERFKGELTPEANVI